MVFTQMSIEFRLQLKSKGIERYVKKNHGKTNWKWPKANDTLPIFGINDLFYAIQINSYIRLGLHNINYPERKRNNYSLTILNLY